MAASDRNGLLPAKGVPSSEESAPAPSSPDARLVALESKLALVDDLVDTLNHTIYRQQQQIDQLSRALAELATEIRAAAPSPVRLPQDEIPPHY